MPDISSGTHLIAGTPTGIAAFVGWAAQGPTDGAILLRSWSDFETQFGGFDPRFYLGYAVSHFFANGGQQAYVVRLASDGSGSAAAPSAAVMTGVHLLDAVPIFNLLAVPGEADPGLIAQLQAYCAGRKAFLLVDSAPGSTFATLQNGPDSQMTGANAINSAFYFPWLNALDPQQNVTRPFPPSGFVAGLYAATDASRGVWRSPAGIGANLTGQSGPVLDLNDTQIGVLSVHAVNCIRHFAQFGDLRLGRSYARRQRSGRFGMEVYFGAPRRPVYRDEPVRGNQVGGVRTEQRTALGATSLERRRLHADAVSSGRIPRHYAGAGLFRQMRWRKQSAVQHRPGCREYSGRLRAAETG